MRVFASSTSFTSIATYINSIIMPHKYINSKDQQPRVNKTTRTEVPLAKRIRATMLYEDGYTKKVSERTGVTPTSVVNVAKRAREHAIKNRLPLDDISNYQ